MLQERQNLKQDLQYIYRLYTFCSFYLIKILIKSAIINPIAPIARIPRAEIFAIALNSAPVGFLSKSRSSGGGGERGRKNPFQHVSLPKCRRHPGGQPVVVSSYYTPPGRALKGKRRPCLHIQGQITAHADVSAVCLVRKRHTKPLLHSLLCMCE